MAGVIDGIPFQHAVVCLAHNPLQSKDQFEFKMNSLARTTPKALLLGLLRLGAMHLELGYSSLLTPTTLQGYA